MDIYKCPKSETQKNFPNKNFNILNNKLKKVLKAEGETLLKPKATFGKEIFQVFLSTTTSFKTFLIIFSFFS